MKKLIAMLCLCVNASMLANENKSVNPDVNQDYIPHQADDDSLNRQNRLAIEQAIAKSRARLVTEDMPWTPRRRQAFEDKEVELVTSSPKKSQKPSLTHKEQTAKLANQKRLREKMLAEARRQKRVQNLQRKASK